MKRFYGSAIFEGVEVTDSALTQLQNIRNVEARRVEYYQTEFKMQIDELESWRTDEISSINSKAARQTKEQYAQLDYCYKEISRIKNQLSNDIQAALNAQADNDEIARLEAEVAHLIYNLEENIYWAHRRIHQIKIDAHYAILAVEDAYRIEYNIRLTRMEKDIAWSHSDATAKIESIFSRLYKEPVFMLRNAKGPCEFCRAKYGTTGTRAQLEKIHCIPPFHDDCRCWIEEVGYVIRSR